MPIASSRTRRTPAQIYLRLCDLGIDPDNPPDSAKSQYEMGGAMMPLLLDKLDAGTTNVICGMRVSEPVRFIDISLAHRFEQNGDLCADPDMEIRIYPDRGMCEALSFSQDLSIVGPIYQRVYSDDGRGYSKKLMKDLNSFLLSWLRNTILQNHKLDH